jgi:hypothetical protein
MKVGLLAFLKPMLSLFGSNKDELLHDAPLIVVVRK